MELFLSPVLSLSSRAITGIPYIRRRLFGAGPDASDDPFLPPVAHYGVLAALVAKHGLWGHHKVDRELSERLGHVYCMATYGYGGEGGFRLVFQVSDPIMIRHVYVGKLRSPRASSKHKPTPASG